MPAPADQVRREDRLGDETPPYQLLFAEDLPEEWKRALDSEYLAEVSQRLGTPGRELYSSCASSCRTTPVDDPETILA